MRRGRHLGVAVVTLTSGVMALFVLSGYLSAQIQDWGRVESRAAEDVGPRLHAAPAGEVFRLWHRRTDLRAGGGAIFLALASSDGTWKSLLEIAPKDRGVVTLAPNLAVGASGELAVTYQWRRNIPRAKQIRLARSLDGGQTWIQSDTPLDTAGTAFSPKAAWGAGRNLVVVWADERVKPRAWNIYARRSPDGGATWGPEQVVSRFPQDVEGDTHWGPELVSDGDKTFLSLWVGLRSWRNRLYLSRSVDGGQTWADPVDLSGPAQTVFAPRVARAGERLVVVWQDARLGRARIFAVSSSDGGATWSSPTRVDHLPPDAVTDAYAPSVVMGPTGEVVVAWQDSRNGRDDIFVGRSLDGGRTWEPEDLRLDTDEPGTAYSRSPTIARAGDGRIAVAWDDDRAGYERIYLRIRGHGDRPTWGPEVVASPAGKIAAKGPGLLWAPKGALYVTWEAMDYSLGPGNIGRRIDGRTLNFDQN